jgi:hypothetical protein
MKNKTCSYCGKEITSKYGKKFCNQHCSAKYNNANRTYLPKDDCRTHKTHCINCGKEIEVNVRAALKKCKCDDCRSSYGNKRCSVCGQQRKNCKRKDICGKKYQLFPSLIKYFGFDQTKIGTEQVYEEFDRIKNLLVEDYVDNELSTTDMLKKYGHDDIRNFNKILNSLNIEKRTISESNRLSILQGKYSPPSCKSYKHGYHITWNGKQIFYRSSYELDYCKELDEKKVDYEVEHLRILYWDSQLSIQRVAIPDFYLPANNEIVEIKSDYTYNEQNMKDKFKAYREHGYKVKLILEHVEKDF